MTIMKKTKIFYILLLGLMLSPFAAHAALITLSPTSPVLAVNDGDTISFDVEMDFTEITLGGSFDIAYDQTALQLQSFNRLDVGDPGFGRDPDILAGLLSGWALGDFSGITGQQLLGSVSFQVLSSMGATTAVSGQDTLSVAGPFFDAGTFQVLPVTYNSVSINRAITQPPAPTPAPEPSTLALLGLGVIGFGWSRRKQAARA